MARLQRYEALTNAACPPDSVPKFSFRAGDVLELPENEAQMLLKAEAIKPLDVPTTAAVPSNRTGGNGNAGGGESRTGGEK